MKKTPMTPQVEATLAFLRADLHVLEEQRTSLINTITRIERQYAAPKETAEAPPPPAPKSQQAGKARSASPGVPPPAGPRRKYRRNAKGEPSTTSLLAEAGEAQAPNTFTLVELRHYLDEHHSARSQKLTNDDLSKHVYILTKREQFIRQTKSEKGGMNTYTYNPHYSKK